MSDMTEQPAGLDLDENSDWLHTNDSYVLGTPQHEVLSQDRAAYGDSVVVLTNADSQDVPASHNKQQHKRERERARYAAMSREEKNARNLRAGEARQKIKEYQSPMEKNGSQDRAPFGDLTNPTNGAAGAEGESRLQLANNSTEQRKRERERTRYATMSGEEKNTRNLRKREVGKKKRGVACILFLRCYTNTLHVIWMNQYFRVVTN
ncbi:hypothetical protein PVAP13_8KG210507 [Panicum virgatum]|uniref:Uncharacterized protein n=1 Tax=Panicum virgatum TaxID=38727 RepID=A0A8T0PV91_PANVG|nr:hypothetical protein PVAP13_8KG210507 [Panicum virgatum]